MNTKYEPSAPPDPISGPEEATPSGKEPATDRGTGTEDDLIWRRFFSDVRRLADLARERRAADQPQAPPDRART